jgi:pilus assembly protein Flp/PilA
MLHGFFVKFSRLRGGAQRAQALVEYALILVLVAIVVIAGLTALAGGISGVFSKIVAGLG